MSPYVASWAHGKGQLTAREKSRQEREWATSLEERFRQLKKVVQLQQKAQHEDICQAAAGIATY